jgi:hypothetical protein
LNQPVKPNTNVAESVRSLADPVDYQQQTDTSLIQLYAEGDLLAFEALYKGTKVGCIDILFGIFQILVWQKIYIRRYGKR